MKTVCNAQEFEFQGLDGRRVVADFRGGSITSDGGALLLREVAVRRGVFERFASCFTDHREASRVEHTVAELLAQRVMGIALGYADLNDHELLRGDPMMGVLSGKSDPTGQSRVRSRDRGFACAGKSTLDRLELTPAGAGASSRYAKLVWDQRKIEEFFVEFFLDGHAAPPREIVLDLDATDDPVHGNQQGRFFHGYYDSYCFLPLYVFCGDRLLCARLRPSNIDGSAGSVKILSRIVAQIRSRWPEVRIIVRADSGFCREKLMVWCEANSVDYVLGLARNKALAKHIARPLEMARELAEATGASARLWEDFDWRTVSGSWGRSRRVVAKAEHLPGKSNPRFVVTSLGREVLDARALYEDLYCARGEMENRIKEQQLDMFADRTPAHLMRANQMRLNLASLAYTIVEEMRSAGLKNTEMAQATCATIRTRLLKIGGLVKVSVRRVLVQLSGGWPWRDLFAQIMANLTDHYAPMRT